ncbi:MAG: hypothetical protein CSA33_07675 [Desulfobulbus propionicus]|nr:MAG: hypothetical protein CSA33_07675 [Desulfobulbus propionicus]
MSTIHSINMLVHAILEWLLVAAGLGLIFLALRAIDVSVVRYAVTGIGVLLSAGGVVFRFRRLRRYT